MNDKQLSRFNKHFGTDVSLSELPLLLERKAYWEDELGVEDGESDEHWYAAIHDVLVARAGEDVTNILEEVDDEDTLDLLRRARNLVGSVDVRLARVKGNKTFIYHWTTPESYEQMKREGMYPSGGKEFFLETAFVESHPELADLAEDLLSEDWELSNLDLELEGVKEYAQRLGVALPKGLDEMILKAKNPDLTDDEVDSILDYLDSVRTEVYDALQELMKQFEQDSSNLRTKSPERRVPGPRGSTLIPTKIFGFKKPFWDIHYPHFAHLLLYIIKAGPLSKGTGHVVLLELDITDLEGVEVRDYLSSKITPLRDYRGGAEWLEIMISEPLDPSRIKKVAEKTFDIQDLVKIAEQSKDEDEEPSLDKVGSIIHKVRGSLVQINDKVACCAESEDGNHMTKQFLQDIAGAAEEMFHLVNEDGELEDWVEFKISRARTDLHDVLSYLRYWLEESHPDWLETTEVSPQDQHLMLLAEASPQLAKIAAKYKGKEVTLNKPTKGDRKKYKVYVKNDKGNIVKVEFGDPNMSIKRDDPERRKNFRARHNCKDPGPKWKARYWSCKMWSKKPVGQILKGK